MQGPISEVNLGKVDLNWNGAIAFLDRDGVLNFGSPNYINSPDELEIIPGSERGHNRPKKAGIQNSNHDKSVSDNAWTLGRRNHSCNPQKIAR